MLLFPIGLALAGEEQAPPASAAEPSADTANADKGPAKSSQGGEDEKSGENVVNDTPPPQTQGKSAGGVEADAGVDDQSVPRRSGAHDDVDTLDAATEWDVYCEGGGRRLQVWHRSFRICVDATEGVTVTRVPVGQYINPLAHQRIHVLVAHRAEDAISIQVDGADGVYVPGIEGVVETSDAHAASAMLYGLHRQAPRPPAVARYVSATYLPDTVDLTVTVTPPDADTSRWSPAVEALATALGKVKASRLALDAKKASGVDASAFDASMDEIAKSVDAALVAARGRQFTTSQSSQWIESRTQEAVDIERALLQLSSETDAVLGAADQEAALARTAQAGSSIAAQASTLASTLNGTATSATLKYPLHVEPTYTGALRLGVAMPLAGAADGSYRVGMPPDATDTSQLVVLDDGSSPVDFEFVVGYTQYFTRRPVSSDRVRLGAYAALGILDVANTEVSALQSVHLGLEFGWPFLSMGVGIAVRDVTRLGNGLEVGSPVASADANITTDQPGVGLSLIVYPTPELFKFGKNDKEDGR